MFGGDAAGPAPGELVKQGFRLSDTIDRVADYSFDQIQYAQGNPAIRFHAVTQVGPKLGRERCDSRGVVTFHRATRPSKLRRSPASDSFFLLCGALR